MGLYDDDEETREITKTHQLYYKHADSPGGQSPGSEPRHL
jgi:hypothetical protein